MRKKLGFPSFVALFIVMSTVISPLVSFAGSKQIFVSNTTSSNTHLGSFNHTGTNMASCTDRPANFTNNMRVTTGAITNSSIRINSHTISISKSNSGIVRGGTAYSYSTSGTTQSRTTILGTSLTAAGSPYPISWNRALPINSSNRNAVVQQHLFPSNYTGFDYCQVRDDMIFTHGGLSSTSNDNDLLSSTININSSKVQKLEDNIKLSGFDKITGITDGIAYTQAFNLDDNLLEVSIHRTPVEVLDVIDTKTYGNIKVYTTQNIEGVNVYTLEIIDNDQYIYLNSTIELENLLTLID